MADRRGDVGGARAARDQCRTAVDDRVPDLAMCVVAVVVRADRAACESRDPVLHGSVSPAPARADAGSYVINTLPASPRRATGIRLPSGSSSVHLLSLNQNDVLSTI